MFTLNYNGFIVATIVAYFIPMIWYSPRVFGKQWLKLSNLKSPSMKASTFILGIVATIVLNFVLLVVINYAGSTTFVAGAIIGGILWIGFIATTMINGVLYEKKPFKLYLINSICYLVAMLIAGGILAVWQ
jgi:hypothetical protein